MSFSKTYIKDEIVFVIENEVINEALFQKIASEISDEKKVGIDMKNVLNINSKSLIEFLLIDKVRLYNLNSEVLAYLAIILKDGFLKSHMNFDDFKNSKRELIRRKLFVA